MRTGMLLVALVAILQTAGAANGATLLQQTPFLDFLQSQQQADKQQGSQARVQAAAVPSDFYSEAEHTTTCLKEVEFRNCRNLEPTGQQQYFESGVTCCSDSESYTHKQPSSPLGEAIQIGACSFDYRGFGFDNYIAVTSTANKIGIFTATCTLRPGAHMCGYPFCDQMVLVAEGSVYDTTGVVSTVDPATVAPLLEASCKGDSRRQAGSKANAPMLLLLDRKAQQQSTITKKVEIAAAGGSSDSSAGASTKGKTGKAGAKHQDPYEYEYDYQGGSGKAKYYLGSAIVFSGPAAIHSRRYDVDVASAWFDYTYSMYGYTAVDEAEAAQKYQVTPYSYTIMFSKSKVDS